MVHPDTPASRQRKRILLAILGTVMVGLPTRTVLYDILPTLYTNYIGDGLYALAIYLGFALLLPKHPAWQLGLITLFWCYGVEIAQLWAEHWPSIITDTRLGRLVFGYSFIWSDIVMYSIGVVVGVGGDRWLWGQGFFAS